MKETYRHFLRNGMNSMLEVSCHLFATTGNGSSWIDGELCFRRTDSYELERNPVKANNDCEHEARLIKRQFVLKNIERILDSKIDSITFEDSNVVRSHYESNPGNYARSIDFPDNIKPDWAQAVFDFNNWWLYNLNCIHGADSIDLWSAHLKKVHETIIQAKKRAFKIINSVEYDVYHSKMKKEASEILREIAVTNSRENMTRPVCPDCGSDDCDRATSSVYRCTGMFKSCEDLES